MSTPLTTVVDALIEFILSLLRDPEAREEFEAAPAQALSRAGLGDVCAEDVRAVAPVVVDHPDVVPRAPVAPVTPVTPDPSPAQEISRIINTFVTVDNRATIVDQSVNQNIWAKGDVTQIFDQDAVVASGDGAAAAGHDATVDSSDTTVTVGDVSVGNTDTTTTITDSDDAQVHTGPTPADPAPAEEAPPAETAADAPAVEAEEAVAPLPDLPADDLLAADDYLDEASTIGTDAPPVEVEFDQP